MFFSLNSNSLIDGKVETKHFKLFNIYKLYEGIYKREKGEISRKEK